MSSESASSWATALHLIGYVERFILFFPTTTLYHYCYSTTLSRRQRRRRSNPLRLLTTFLVPRSNFLFFPHSRFLSPTSLIPLNLTEGGSGGCTSTFHFDLLPTYRVYRAFFISPLTSSVSFTLSPRERGGRETETGRERESRLFRTHRRHFPISRQTRLARASFLPSSFVR